MKQILAGVITLSLATAALADVTVNFRNNVLSGDVKVSFGINTIGATVGSPLVNGIGGKSFVAQLFVQDGASLTPVGATANFRSVAQGDALAGTWSGANRTVVGPAADATLTLVVRAWDSSFASYDAAFAGNGLAGQSAPFTYKNALSSPPATTDTYMANFKGFEVSQIPEPTTIALAGLGIAGLIFLRRK